MSDRAPPAGRPIARAVGLVARVALAWIATYTLAFGLSELSGESSAERAARAGARLPSEDVSAPAARAAIVAATARELGIADRRTVRVVGALGRAATLELGWSWRDRRPVLEVVTPGLPATGLRCGAALILAVVLGAGAGLAGAQARGAIGAVLGTGIAAALSVPTVWLCQVGLALAGADADGAGAMAIAILGIAPAAVVAAHVRGAVAPFLTSPLAVALAARGVGPTGLVWIHGARLALAGLAPLAASAAGFVIGASIVVERALALPGAGRVFAAAASAGDVPVIAALAGISAAAVAAVGGGASWLAEALDPRLDEAA